MAKTKERKPAYLSRESLVALRGNFAGERRERFQQTSTARIYLGTIDRELAALAAELRVDAGGETDATTSDVQNITALGKALWKGLESVSDDPTFSEAVRAAARRVLSVLGPKAPSSRVRPAARVARASTVRERLPDIAAALAMLPLSSGGVSFAARIEQWCTAAEEVREGIVDVVVKRDQAQPASALVLAKAVVRVNQLLRRARATLRDEIAFDPAVPRTLESELFGLMDELALARRPATRRGKGAARAKPAGEAPAAGDTPPPAADGPTQPAAGGASPPDAD